jgi:positive regulator of sigma E activity
LDKSEDAHSDAILRPTKHEKAICSSCAHNESRACEEKLSNVSAKKTMNDLDIELSTNEMTGNKIVLYLVHDSTLHSPIKKPGEPGFL